MGSPVPENNQGSRDSQKRERERNASRNKERDENKRDLGSWGAEVHSPSSAELCPKTPSGLSEREGSNPSLPDPYTEDSAQRGEAVAPMRL